MEHAYQTISAYGATSARASGVARSRALAFQPDANRLGTFPNGLMRIDMRILQKCGGYQSGVCTWLRQPLHVVFEDSGGLPTESACIRGEIAGRLLLAVPVRQHGGNERLLAGMN